MSRHSHSKWKKQPRWWHQFKTECVKPHALQTQGLDSVLGITCEQRGHLFIRLQFTLRSNIIKQKIEMRYQRCVCMCALVHTLSMVINATLSVNPYAVIQRQGRAVFK